MNNIIDKAKKYFYDHIARNDDIYGLERHLPLMEKWAKRLLKENPQVDEEVVLLGVWLHDIAHYPPESSSDHAVKGEAVTKEFLTKNNYPKEKMEKVLHCVRSHRCKDVLPETLEAKIIACADSASHLTDLAYLDIVMDGRDDYALGKLERDFRDVGTFPEIKKELEPLYLAWKKLLKEFIAVKKLK